MVPSHRVFGANRVSPRHPSPLIAYRVQKKAGQRRTSRPGIERTAPKRLDDATRLVSVSCPPCGFGPDGAGALFIAAPPGSPIAQIGQSAENPKITC